MSKVFTITEGLENMGAIKSGGQGSVYKGRRVGEIITAIKLLPTPIFGQEPENKHYRDFISEVKKLQKVGEVPNPNIVKILSSGVSETGSFPYIEMEFIEGPDLAELLKPPHPPIFTIKEVIKVAEHLSNALAQCHKVGIKHGDIKSNNVKYNQLNGNYVLLDFGLAILSTEERRTSMRQAGAVEFMAPEQHEGEYYFESDVYSYGIVLYELLTGQVPFILGGNTETARNKVMLAHMEETPPDLLVLRKQNMPPNWSDLEKNWEVRVPEWLINLIYKCLEKKPYKRFESGIALQDYVLYHHIHAPVIASVSLSENLKSGKPAVDNDASIKVKEDEITKLKDVISKQENEIQELKNNEPTQLAALKKEATVAGENLKIKENELARVRGIILKQEQELLAVKNKLAVPFPADDKKTLATEASLKLKEEELSELKAIVVKQDSELQTLRRQDIELRATKKRGTIPVEAYQAKNAVSKSTFYSLLAILLVVTCLAIYALFFRTSRLEASNSTETASTQGDSLQVQSDNQGKKNPGVANTPKTNVNEEDKNSTTDPPIKAGKPVEKVSTTSVPFVVQDKPKKKEKDLSDEERQSTYDNEGVQYKVRDVANFHNKPEPGSKRAAFINHWNNAVLTPLDEKNGFIYIIYTNTEGQTSKGWLSKADLLKVE